MANQVSCLTRCSNWAGSCFFPDNLSEHCGYRSIIRDTAYTALCTTSSYFILVGAGIADPVSITMLTVAACCESSCGYILSSDAYYHNNHNLCLSLCQGHCPLLVCIAGTIFFSIFACFDHPPVVAPPVVNQPTIQISIPSVSIM